MPEPQVDRDHYAFEAYVPKRRWASMWHQVTETERFAPDSVLELGPGPGLFLRLIRRPGRQVLAVDIDPDLGPDVVADATALPFRSGAFDVTCAFQVLEHLPFERSISVFRELERCATRAVIISLPDAATQWSYEFHIPRLGPRRVAFTRPRLRARLHRFDGQHHWEVSTRGHELERVVAELPLASRLERTFRVPELPYHRFLIFVLDPAPGPHSER